MDTWYFWSCISISDFRILYILRCLVLNIEERTSNMKMLSCISWRISISMFLWRFQEHYFFSLLISMFSDLTNIDFSF